MGITAMVNFRASGVYLYFKGDVTMGKKTGRRIYRTEKRVRRYRSGELSPDMRLGSGVLNV